MNHSAKFPAKPQSKCVWFAHNPECEADACWFHSEQQAFEHFCDYAKFYRYTVINEAECTCELLDEDFAERRDEMQADVQAENADRFYQFMKASAL